jgi:hypothetical protein
MEAKQQMLKVIEELPDDAGVEEALDRLYPLHKVDRGLRQAYHGELLTQEEVRERMAKWQVLKPISNPVSQPMVESE